MSGVEISTRRDAAKRQEQIRHVATTFAEAKAKLIALVQEAKESNDHLALGYASWTAYLADTFGDEPLRLARDDRQDMVRVLAAEGMSTRAIAPIVGVHHDTVASDLKTARVGNPTRAPEPATPSEVDAHAADPGFLARTDGIEPSFRVSRSVTGLDGKAYARPDPIREPNKEEIVGDTLVAPVAIAPDGRRYPRSAEQIAKWKEVARLATECNMSPFEISKEMGLKDQTVRKIIAKLGIEATDGHVKRAAAIEDAKRIGRIDRALTSAHTVLSVVADTEVPDDIGGEQAKEWLAMIKEIVTTLRKKQNQISDVISERAN